MKIVDTIHKPKSMHFEVEDRYFESIMLQIKLDYYFILNLAFAASS